MTYVKINGAIYPATINGKIADREWDGRESKTITLEMTHAEADAIFVDGLAWSIIAETVKDVEKVQEDGTVVIDGETAEEEYDNSDYSVAGDIIDHRDGTLSIKMGKPTAQELLAVITGEVE